MGHQQIELNVEVILDTPGCEKCTWPIKHDLPELGWTKWSQGASMDHQRYVTEWQNGQCSGAVRVVENRLAFRIF